MVEKHQNVPCEVVLIASLGMIFYGCWLHYAPLAWIVVGAILLVCSIGGYIHKKRRQSNVP